MFRHSQPFSLGFSSGNFLIDESQKTAALLDQCVAPLDRLLSIGDAAIEVHEVDYCLDRHFRPGHRGEPIVFPAVLHTVDGLTNLLAPGLNAPGKDRYIRRGGRLYDLRTGRIID